MDFQILFNVAAGIAGAAGGWVLKMVYDQLQTLNSDIKSTRKDFTDFVQTVPETYARRDDLKDKFEQLLAAVIRVEGKIDKHNG